MADGRQARGVSLCFRSLPEGTGLLGQPPTRTPNQVSSVWRAKAHEQDAVVRTRGELSQVREIQVLGDQESRFLLRRLPNLSVCMTKKQLVMQRMNDRRRATNSLHNSRFPHS